MPCASKGEVRNCSSYPPEEHELTYDRRGVVQRRRVQRRYYERLWRGIRDSKELMDLAQLIDTWRLAE